MTSTVNVTDRFPDGTLVHAFLARNHPPNLTTTARGVALPPPDASAVATATVAAGSVTFTGLTAGELYVAAATVDGAFRQLAFVAA